jgi:alcohol dehydrogenase
MKALVYRGPGKKALEERPKPEITAATDAIVKIVKTTICGTDLHILKGDVPTCQPGRILGQRALALLTRSGQPSRRSNQAIMSSSRV